MTAARQEAPAALDVARRRRALLRLLPEKDQCELTQVGSPHLARRILMNPRLCERQARSAAAALGLPLGIGFEQVAAVHAETAADILSNPDHRAKAGLAYVIGGLSPVLTPDHKVDLVRRFGKDTADFAWRHAGLSPLRPTQPLPEGDMIARLGIELIAAWVVRRDAAAAEWVRIVHPSGYHVAAAAGVSIVDALAHELRGIAA